MSDRRSDENERPDTSSSLRRPKADRLQTTSTHTVPTLLRTPPSTADLSLPEGLFDQSEKQTPPATLPSDANGSSASSSVRQPVAASPMRIPPTAPVPIPNIRRQFGTVPFPSKAGSSSSSSQGLGVMTESNLSERPDTIASLIHQVPALGVGRGRRNSRGGITGSLNASRPSWSDLVESDMPATGTSPPLRDGTPAESKRVSFDSDSVQQSQPPAIGRDTPERRETSGGGLKRISSSLERVRQMFRPSSDPLAQRHDDDDRSQPQSRAQSPRRFQLRRNPHFWPPVIHTPVPRPWFRPCDPYDISTISQQRPTLPPPPPTEAADAQGRVYTPPRKPPPYPICLCCGSKGFSDLVASTPLIDSVAFWTEYTVRQVYRHCLLRLPSLYFQRVWRIIIEAQVSRAELDQIIQQRQLGTEFPISIQWVPPVVSPGLARFRMEWEDFIDTLLKEWKTFNVVSALMLSAILTIFQIDGSQQPITRTAALASLVSGMWSLIFGALYVIRFQSMKDMVKATRWAEAAQAAVHGVFWNVWVFLCLPAISLAYSVIFFCVAIMSFVWTTGTVADPNPIQTDLAWIPRMVITIGFGLGAAFLYGVITTFQSYSDPWPIRLIDMADTYSSPRRTPHDLESGLRDAIDRGRSPDTEREARERRTSMRKFGSPDVYLRASAPPAAHSAPVLGEDEGAGLEHPVKGVGGFIAPRSREVSLYSGTASAANEAHEVIPMATRGMTQPPPPFEEKKDPIFGVPEASEDRDPYGSASKRSSPPKGDLMLPRTEEERESEDDDFFEDPL